jgi:GT2 family glycosyltransferase
LIRVSVIIPTFNRPSRLGACLAALARSSYPRSSFEVIVVDDGGEHDLDPLIANVGQNLDVRAVAQSNGGPASARNLGVMHARGDLLAFTDDDCLPERDWLSALADRFARDPSRIYGGHTINALPKNVYSTASQSLIDYLYGYYNADPERARFFSSNNIAMSREAFLELGGFDSGFPLASGEDRDLCDRWLRLGRRMSFAPEARVLHHHALDLLSYWRQHFNYGTGARRYRTRKRQRDGKAPGIEPVSFYLKLLSHPQRCNLPRSSTLSLLLGLSQVANAGGFLRETIIGQRLEGAAERRGQAQARLQSSQSRVRSGKVEAEE